MNKRVFRILEFNKIQERLKSFCVSSLGQQKVDELIVFTEPKKVEYALDETDKAVGAILNFGNPPLFGISSVKESLEFVGKGGSLSPGELLDIVDGLRSAKQMQAYAEELPESTLREQCMLLAVFPHIISHIEKAIVSADEIADDASPKLRQIRKDMVSKESAIRDKLQSIIQSRAYRDQLQDYLITMREGRYVVPVKAEYKNRFDGVVHDQSGSGATAYIEPMSIVQLNNDLRTLEGAEQEEILRILAELSAEVYQEHDAIENNQKLLTDLDFVFAKAKLALNMEATRPFIHQQGYIDLIDAKHPLLNVKKVVPISISIGDNYSVLVVTGPNTGGKTVTLKTVGLMQLMGQAGLFLPCGENSKIGVFDEIYADIGDEQSIEQSLSTFSSHMSNIVELLKHVTSKDLVLLDELGAGTDPTEGAALAMSILEELRNIGVYTIATTHYSQLKTYALTTEQVMNASVEFDVRTLSPTYRLLIGMPGKSNAFEISRRLGLSEEVIEQAKSTIGIEEQKMEDLFSNLEKNRLLMEEHRKELEKNRKEIEQLKEKLARETEKNKESREKIMQKAKEEAREVIDETKAYADDIIRDLKKLDRLSPKERAREIERMQRGLREKSDNYARDDSAFLRKTSDEIIRDLKLGEEVEIVTMGQRGYVASLPDNQNNVVVEVGILKINTDLKTLRRVKSDEHKGSNTSTAGIYRTKAQEYIPSEIDIRGKNIEEGIMEVGKFLDDALIVDLKTVEIIHGKGTGVLRKGIQEYLKKHPHVKSFRDGGFSEGGLGVTIVTLK